MQRLWVRWVGLVLFVAVLGTAFVNLGEWQLRRLSERQANNTTITRNESAAVVPASAVFGKPIVDADAWQRVSVTGTFDAEHQLVIRYRQNADEDGYEVVTPLRAAFGTVLVDRGFVGLAAGTQIPETAPPPPSGEVTVIGHVRRSENGRRGATQPVDGSARLINSAAIQGVLPYPIVDGYIGALSMDPPQTGTFETVALPEISEGPHFWYAVQWFMFTGIGVLGIVVFIRGDLRERRLARERAAAALDEQDEPAEAEQPTAPVS